MKFEVLGCLPNELLSVDQFNSPFLQFRFNKNSLELIFHNFRESFLLRNPDFASNSKEPVLHSQDHPFRGPAWPEALEGEEGGRNGAEVLVLDILGACNPLCILSMTWKGLDPEKASAGLHLAKRYNYLKIQYFCCCL